MFLRHLLLSAFAILPFLHVGATSIPSNLPETRAVYQDLSRLRSECDRTITMTRQLRSAVASVRGGFDQSIRTTQAIRAMDKRLVKLIDQLKPYASIPKIRTATRTLSKNLTRIQTRIHQLRVKSDRCEKSLLRPSRDRLKTLESSLRTAELKLREMSTVAAQWMAKLAESARTANQFDDARRALELTSRTSRPMTRAAVGAVARVRSQADSVGYQLNRVNQNFDAFETVERSLKDLGRKMEDGEKLAGNLDKILRKRLSIKLPLGKKTLSFTIREILEKPGKVLGIVLKPLEKMVDTVLQPVLRKAKLEIQAPKGLAELESRLHSIDSAGRSLTDGVSSLQRQLQTELNSHLNQMRASLNRMPEVTRQAQRRVKPAPVERPRQPAPSRKAPAMFVIFD